jgi:CRISPR-associated protein Csx14
MAEASIPVDLYNPGQVFACLGFMEAADVLLGDAEGGFDWSDNTNVRFALRAKGERSPLEAVLEFLGTATVEIIRPQDVKGPWPASAIESGIFPAPLRELLKSDKKSYSTNGLPISITDSNSRISVSNWLEGDGRSALKLFAGNQVGAQLMTNALNGDEKKAGTVGIRQLAVPASDPLGQLGPVGGRFGYDSRGAWDAIRVGTSLDAQGILLFISPVVEALAAIGLENARPEFLSTYKIRYAAWGHGLPLSLARLALTQPDRILPRQQCRYFCAHLGDDKQYKKCFPAQEEPNT